MRRPVCRPGTTQNRPRRPFRRRGRFSLDPLPEDRHAELSPSRHFVRSLFSFPGLLPPSFVLSPPVVPYFPLPPSPSFLLPVTLSLPPYVILSEAKDLLSPAACQRNGEKILRRLRLLRMTGRRPGMLRDDGTKTRHVREQRYENRPACGRRRRNRHTRGHWHANRPVPDFSPCHPELSPCHPERSEGSSFLRRPSEEREKDPSSAPPPQDDRAEARHADDRTEARHA